MSTIIIILSTVVLFFTNYGVKLFVNERAFITENGYNILVILYVLVVINILDRVYSFIKENQ